MVLPGAQLFPGALLPLYIFEPRYRAMLHWSLEHDRMFCIAPMKPGITEAQDTNDFHHIIGIGLIRASVQREDGTSHLVLQGLARTRIVDFLQNTPFCIAELRELSSESASSVQNRELTARLLETFNSLFDGPAHPNPALAAELQKIDNASVLADMIAHACLHDSEARQAVFEELNASRRVAMLIEYLQEEGSRFDSEN